VMAKPSSTNYPMSSLHEYCLFKQDYNVFFELSIIVFGIILKDGCVILVFRYKRIESINQEIFYTNSNVSSRKKTYGDYGVGDHLLPFRTE
jgi:hypothetical protein